MEPIETKRLLLRPWRDADLEPFAELNADPRVMERIGMHHAVAEDFDHPRIPEGDPMRRHLLYRIGRSEWKAGQ
jgi:RimJ/RimL family protein N-acetyltransferase